MRRWLGDLPIRTKLLLLGLLASGTALGLACAAFVVNEQVTLKRQIVRSLATQARIIGANSAPTILFQDPEAAEQTLQALAAEVHVEAASITTADGVQFAAYRRRPSVLPPAPVTGRGATRHVFVADAVVLSQVIEYEGRRLGTVTLRSDLVEVQESVKAVLLVGVGVFGVSLLVALLVSTWLARSLAQPILALVAVTRRVAEEKDFTVRPPPAGSDEIGLLVGSVSRMLEEIHSRDVALASAHDELEVRNRALEHEVVERRAAEQALEVRNQELARSNADLEQFAYVASHDLKEPLRMVSGYVQLLAEEYGDKLGAEAHEYVTFAVEGAQRMNALIQALLAYSRVGARGLKLDEVPLEEALGDVLADLRAAQQEAGAAVTHDGLPTVAADAAQVRQLLQNLLANAMKFRGPDPPRIHVAAELRGDEWLVSVTDNGLGIDPRHSEKIFVLFQRLHSRDAYPGTGIGLSVCKRIVERHGGKIWVESTPGTGSTFRFTLPRIRNEG